jgi:hypothetical protein
MRRSFAGAAQYARKNGSSYPTFPQAARDPLEFGAELGLFDTPKFSTGSVVNITAASADGCSRLPQSSDQ